MNEEKLRKQIEALTFEIKKYQMALDQSDIDFFDINLKNGQAKQSDNILKILGYTPEEMNTFEKRNTVVDPDDLKLSLKKIEQLKAGLIDHTDLQFRLKSKSGQWYWIKHDGLIVEKDDQRHFVGLLREITDEKSYMEKLRYLANFDGLTETYNRRSGLDKLRKDIADKNQITISYIDMNDFKEINDAFGHLTGDRVLKEFASSVVSVLPKNSYLVRIGGDEFLIVFINYNDVEGILEVIQSKSIVLREGWEVSFSIGTVDYNEEKHTTVDRFIHHADMLMYTSKKNYKLEKSESIAK